MEYRDISFLDYPFLNAVSLDANMHPDSSTEIDSSSNRTGSPGGDTPGCSQQHPPDSFSTVDSAKVVEHPAITCAKQDLAGKFMHQAPTLMQKAPESIQFDLIENLLKIIVFKRSDGLQECAGNSYTQ